MSCHRHVVVSAPGDTPQKCHFTLGFCMLKFSALRGVPSQAVLVRVANELYTVVVSYKNHITSNSFVYREN